MIDSGSVYELAKIFFANFLFGVGYFQKTFVDFLKPLGRKIKAHLVEPVL